jgi:hypothetical protein
LDCGSFNHVLKHSFVKPLQKLDTKEHHSEAKSIRHWRDFEQINAVSRYLYPKNLQISKQ